DAHQRARITRAEEMQVTRTHFTGGHVVLSDEAENLTLDGAERRADVPRLVKATRDVHEIEVRWLGRQRDAIHHEARAKHGHVEALAVECHEHRCVLHALRDAREDGRLFTKLTDEELLADEAVVIEKREADQKRNVSR